MEIDQDIDFISYPIEYRSNLFLFSGFGFRYPDAVKITCCNIQQSVGSRTNLRDLSKLTIDNPSLKKVGIEIRITRRVSQGKT
jgi:hypothetical protein